MGNFVTDLLTKGAKDAVLGAKKDLAAGVREVTRPAIQSAEDAITGKGPAAAASAPAEGEVRRRPTGVQPRPSAASLAADAAPAAGAAASSVGSFLGGLADRFGAAFIGKERVEALKRGAAQVDTGAVVQRVQDGAKVGAAAVVTAGAVAATAVSGVAAQVVEAVTSTKEDAKTTFRQSEIREQNAAAEQAKKALEAQAAGQQPAVTVQVPAKPVIETTVSPTRAFEKAADPVAPVSKTQGLDQMIDEAFKTADPGRLETLIKARAQVAKIGEPAP